MPTLAIRGHKTRGKEVIEILEMMGGKNKISSNGLKWFNGTNVDSYYTIEEDNYIHMRLDSRKGDYIKFTLEEFFENYPYKVEDKVQHKGATSCGCIFVIEKMQWVDSGIEYTIRNLWNNNYRTTVKAEDLQSYKEEDMKNGIVYDEIDFNRCPAADKVHLILGINYEIREESGEYYVVKKLPKYPKTYEECCKVLDYCGDYFLTTYDNNGKFSAISNILNSVNVLTKVLICRNAYWKIAGEQMGLGKPWEPDWSTKYNIKYVIEVYCNNVRKNSQSYSNTILAFPSAEMRDDFYENFNKEIEECKELL